MEDVGTRLGEVKTRVRDGVAAISDLVGPLDELQQGATLAAKNLDELAGAAGEQKQASEQIARNTERIAASAEENHAAITGSRDTAEQLRGMADRLLASTSRFKLA
jgi:methyl-accepting chemotaxis protein